MLPALGSRVVDPFAGGALLPFDRGASSVRAGEIDQLRLATHGQGGRDCRDEKQRP